jgi:hypothetical protein
MIRLTSNAVSCVVFALWKAQEDPKKYCIVAHMVYDKISHCRYIIWTREYRRIIYLITMDQQCGVEQRPNRVKDEMWEGRQRCGQGTVYMVRINYFGLAPGDLD